MYASTDRISARRTKERVGRINQRFLHDSLDEAGNVLITSLVLILLIALTLFLMDVF